MSEESGNKAEGTPTEESGVSASDVRSHDLFKKVIGEKDAKLESALNELKTLRESIANEAKNKDLKIKEEQGRFDEVKAQLLSENETLRNKHQKEMTKLQLENALVSEGADEYFKSWAIQGYEGGDIGEYVDGLKNHEKHSQRFAQQTAIGNPTPNGAVPAPRSPDNWNQIRKDLSGRDPGAREAADQKVKAYAEQYGKLPW